MKTTLLVFFSFLSFIGFSQEDAWVFFTDKPNANIFFSNPLSELTQRSLDRRTTQNIALDIKDAPLHQPYVNQITAGYRNNCFSKVKMVEHATY